MAKADGQGVGASLRRKEDDRFLHGTGEYVGDLKFPGMWHAAFCRSQFSHARIRDVTPPAGAGGQVFRAADLEGLKPIRSTASLPGFQGSDFPVLAGDKVRHVGEQIAMAVAPTRAEAEDIVDAIAVEYEELPPVVSTADARAAGGPLVHEHWTSNIVCETRFENGDVEAAKAAARPRRHPPLRHGASDADADGGARRVRAP